MGRRRICALPAWISGELGTQNTEPGTALRSDPALSGPPCPDSGPGFQSGLRSSFYYRLRLLEKLFYDSLDQYVGNGVDLILHGFLGFGLCGKRFRVDCVNLCHMVPVFRTPLALDETHARLARGTGNNSIRNYKENIQESRWDESCIPKERKP